MQCMLLLQFNENSINYRESLLRFVENLGPTAQRIAFKKLEALQTPRQPATLNDNWHAFAAALLSTSFSSIEKGKSHGTSIGEPNMLASGSSNNVFARVYPTRVVSGPQPNLSELSLVSQSRPKNSYSIPSSNLTALSPVHKHQRNLSDLLSPVSNVRKNTLNYVY